MKTDWRKIVTEFLKFLLAILAGLGGGTAATMM